MMNVNSNKPNAKGFTIVELLIVIVIIAILAVIASVAYNGAQVRAENSKTTQAVNQYLKAVTLYSGEKSTYPVSPNACLGPYDASGKCGNVGSGSCFLTAQGYQSAFSNTMKTYMTSELPSLSSQQITCQNTLVSGGYYYSTDGKDAAIQYVLRGVSSCPAPSYGSVSNQYKLDDAIRCRVNLPTL